MPRTPARPLVTGAYIEDQNDVILGARHILVHTIERVYPELLEQLYKHVYPTFEEVAPLWAERHEVIWCSIPAHTKIPESSPLSAVIVQWAQRFNAQSDWFLDWVLRTLNDWYSNPQSRELLAGNPMQIIRASRGGKGRIFVGKKFRFAYAGWCPQTQTFGQYKAKVRAALERKLHDYERKTQYRLESCGFSKAPRKYQPLNFEWFVLYQFAGWSSTKIVKREVKYRNFVDESTVLKGIKAAAKLTSWQSLRLRLLKKN